VEETALREIAFTKLTLTSNDEALAIYRGALDWSLDDPIIIKSRKELLSEVTWKGLVEPFNHQVTNLLTFCRRLPVTLLADDVGLGKTISAGLIASELMTRKRVKAILVVCPKILTYQWQEELKSKFGIDSIIAAGSELLSAKCNSENRAIITTYNSARMYLEQLPEDRFQMLILDEAHKLRNLFGTNEPPQVAQVFNRVLEKRFFKYVLMLTATPIQNRLWDLYSVIHLLTVAKGHDNPFGSPAQFKRKFILDDELSSRRLKPEAKEEFQSIVFGYMSRIRRNDSNLVFPDRKVLMQRVSLSTGESELLSYLSSSITKFNVLVQIGLLKAFTSSPHAVASFAKSLVKNGNAPTDFGDNIKNIVARIGQFSKLRGLSQLLFELSRKNPEGWRAVVFTTSRETQTTIEAHLTECGYSFGLINGNSGPWNQETLKWFRQNPPGIRVIISTEAGAEGVNLQAANVLINFDLPWNPMVVEQRIGRIQRLGSTHGSMVIYNLVLAETFDEYIVGRLMEKLQMAAHAIGDVEALLESSGLGDEEGTVNFEEQILQLVLASIKGQDTEHSARMTEQSIDAAKSALEEQEKTINSLLGELGDIDISDPQPPNLEPIQRTMSAKDFVVRALEAIGRVVTINDQCTGTIELDGRTSKIAVEGATDQSAEGHLDYRPSGVAFERLVQQLVKQGVCKIEHRTTRPDSEVKVVIENWAESFAGKIVDTESIGFDLGFVGTVTARTKTFVAHDSYETIIDLPCSKHQTHSKTFAMSAKQILSAEEIGLEVGLLSESITSEPSIAEFNRYYLQRREVELQAVSGDDRKRKKLADEFTPRIEAFIVGLTGKTMVTQRVKVKTRLQGSNVFISELSVNHSTGQIVQSPRFETCSVSGHSAPSDCFAKCDISGRLCILDELKKSDFSGKYMMPEFAVRCAASGKLASKDETVTSDLTGLPVHETLFVTSVVSGTKAEPVHFGKCEFTSASVLKSELIKSEYSGKLFRKDRTQGSDVNGKIGDTSEFLQCPLSKKFLRQGEGERCASTSVEVFPGQLQTCHVTSSRVLPSELMLCAETGVIAMKDQFVPSSVSGQSVLASIAVQSIDDSFCLPRERKYCNWSNSLWHPNDIATCQLTNCEVHTDYLNKANVQLEDFTSFMVARIKSLHFENHWPTIASKYRSQFQVKDCEIVSALVSPGKNVVACKAVLRSMLGFRKKNVAFLYSLNKMKIIGNLIELNA
jgi:superfamily II DNA or RNA helicase